MDCWKKERKKKEKKENKKNDRGRRIIRRSSCARFLVGQAKRIHTFSTRIYSRRGEPTLEWAIGTRLRSAGDVPPKGMETEERRRKLERWRNFRV